MSTPEKKLEGLPLSVSAKIEGESRELIVADMLNDEIRLSDQMTSVYKQIEENTAKRNELEQAKLRLEGAISELYAVSIRFGIDLKAERAARRQQPE
jgi:hypothetical protein